MDNIASLDNIDTQRRLAENQHALQSSEEFIHHQQSALLEMDFPSKETLTRRSLSEISASRDMSTASKAADIDVVSSLTMKVHELSASLQASEMRNNHLELQLQAVSMSEQQLRNERDSLQFVLAESEQDKLLLETKLKGIANFEGGIVGDSHDVLLENIRGKLLNMANQNIAELSDALRSQERKDDAKKLCEQKFSKLVNKNKSLRSEMRQMSNQLAQRTVLYAAQERRFLDTSRANNAMQTEKTQETTSLRARLQQLEHQFDITDRARVEAIIECRNQREAQEVLTAQVDDLKERHQELEMEISALTAQNVSLHETVSHLRGADYDEIERGIATELQTLRVDAEAKGEHLKQQLDQARSILEREAEHRESLVEEVVRLRNELGEKVVLLQKAEDRIRLGSFHTTQAQNTNNQYKRQVLSRQPRTEESPLPSPDAINSAYVDMFDDEEEVKSDADETQFYDSNHINMLYGSNLANSVLHVLQGLIRDFFGEDSNVDMNETMLLEIIKDGSAWHSLDRESDDDGDNNETRIALQDRMKQMVRDAYSCVFVEESGDPWSYISHSFFSILGIIAERVELLKNREKQSFMSGSMLGSRPLSENGSTTLSKNFLIGNNNNDPADDSVETSAVDALQEELTALKEELIVRRKRERQLRASLKDQGSKLTLVLQRAASLHMPPNSDTIKTRRHTTLSDDERKALKKQLEEKDLAMACLVSEKDVMSEQMEGYREEIKWLQDTVERGQQIIDNDDGGSGYYEERIQRLQQELDSVKKGRQDVEEEDQESIVSKLRDEFMENNKRLHLQAEVVKLQDEVSDKSLLIESLNMMCEEYRSRFDQVEMQWESRFTQFEDELIEQHASKSSEMESELKKKYNEALEVEHESMQRQVQQLLASMKQQYEEEKAEESERDSHTDVVVVVEKQSIGSQTQSNDDDVSDPKGGLHEQVLHEALEIQKLSLEQEHQLDLAEKIKSLHGKFEEQLVNTLTKYKTKYENRLKTQKEDFDEERKSWNTIENDLPDFDETPIKHPPKRGTDVNLSESLDNTIDAMAALRYDSPEKEESRDEVRGLNESNNEISFGSDSSVWKSARGSYDSSTMSMSRSTDIYESPGTSRMTNQSITRSPEAWNGGVSIADDSKHEHTPPLHCNNTATKASRTRTKNTPTSAGPTRRKLKESPVIGAANTKKSAPGSGSLRRSFDKALDELNRLSHAAVHSQIRKEKLPRMPSTSRSAVRKFPQVKSSHHQ